jgi:hypothetical protein
VVSGDGQLEAWRRREGWLGAWDRELEGGEVRVISVIYLDDIGPSWAGWAINQESEACVLNGAGKRISGTGIDPPSPSPPDPTGGNFPPFRSPWGSI